MTNVSVKQVNRRERARIAGGGASRVLRDNSGDTLVGTCLQVTPNHRLATVRILIVGDPMLDRYWFGDVGRISPEAPVPVVLVRDSEERLGGAANVARNVAALGAHTGLLAVVGDDEAGRTLAALLPHAGIQGYLHTDRTLNTTVKLRVIARQQQIVRLDFEKTPEDEVLAAHFDQFAALLPGYDLVILSNWRARAASRCWSTPRATTTRATPAPRC